MKTILTALLFCWPVFANAADASFLVTGGSDENVIRTASDAGLGYDRMYYLNTGPYLGKKMSAQVTYSSTSYNAVTFSTSSYSIGSAAISATSHGFTLGIPVLYIKTAGTDPAPLVNGTTYYAVPYSANIVYLATTAAQAIANDPILFSSKTLTGATQTYTLTALAITGTPSFKWQSSNDSVGWADVNTSSVTISAYTAGGVTSAWDFDNANFSNYRLNIIAPTRGGLNIKAVVNLVR